MTTHSSRPRATGAGDDSVAPAVPATVPGPGEPPRATRPEDTSDAAEAEELARLRADVSALRAQVDTRRRRASVIGATRRVTAAVLVAVTAFALLATVVGGWAATTALSTDRWVATVAPLPRDPRIATAVAEYTTVQLFQAIDVERRLRAVLPEQAAFIAGPVAGQLREAVRKTVTNVLQSERFQPIWVELNRRAHQRALAIIDGSGDLVVTRQDRVEIDLLPLINQVLRELSAQLPTMFGKQLSLPDLSSGAIPDNLRVRVQGALGVALPENFARFTVYDSGQLWAAQQAVMAAKRDLVLLAVGTIVLLLAALLASPERRRTLLQLGLWLVIASVAVTAALRAVRTQLLLEVPAGVYRDGVAATLTSVFSLLRTRGTQIIWIGALLALMMYLVGPGRGPTWLRRQVSTGARAAGGAARGLASHGPDWSARHLDVLRVGAVVVAVGLALILSSWTSLLVIALVLAAFEILVTVAGRSGARRSAPPASAAPGAGAG